MKSRHTRILYDANMKRINLFVISVGFSVFWVKQNNKFCQPGMSRMCDRSSLCGSHKSTHTRSAALNLSYRASVSLKGSLCQVWIMITFFIPAYTMFLHLPAPLSICPVILFDGLLAEINFRGSVHSLFSPKGPSINYVTRISWFFYSSPPCHRWSHFWDPPPPSVSSHILQFYT